MTTARSEPGAAPERADVVSVDAVRAAAAAGLPDRIAFLGFGLIGGSIALALRAAGATAHLAAWTPAGDGPAAGAEYGVLDAAPRNPAVALDGAGLVILAGPPMSVLDHLGHLGGPMRDRLAAGATITDVASTKAIIVARAEDLGLPFVGGHPMAGRETTGFGSATAELFIDRPWVVAAGDEASPRQLALVDDLAVAAGARPVHMAALDHDLAVASISHLPLIASAALVESVADDTARWPAALALAAGGWRDMTRLARGDAEMGGGIIATNARPIADALRAYRDALDAWLVELERLTDESRPALPQPADLERVRARLAAARAILHEEATR
ncbi:MAG TPA: prephenate dehydrogenase/arogenate dehydrogenase family protein [Candidatus Limnocylindrales bacterium]|jgi:prephenate dehydrogenase